MSPVKTTSKHFKLGIDEQLTETPEKTLPVFKIEKFSDLIRSLRPETEGGPLSLILEDERKRSDKQRNTVGLTDAGFPRPYTAGIWFRGQANSKFPVTPSIFRVSARNGSAYFTDEKNSLNELRLRLGVSGEDYRSYFATLCQLRHYSLPCRLLDWSESPSVALYFALRNAIEEDTDAVFSIINVYRLNSVASVLGGGFNPGLAYPHHIDVLLRSAMATHMYLEDAVMHAISEFSSFRDQKTSHVIEILSSLFESEPEDPRLQDIMTRARMPIAVYPNRRDTRMIAQSSTFTLHGGKIIYGRDFVSAPDIRAEARNTEQGIVNFIDSPLDLDVVNKQQYMKGVPFLVHIKIPAGDSVRELYDELEMLGMDESRLFVNTDSHISAVSRRWTVKVDE